MLTIVGVQDVYVSESLFDEAKRMIRPLPNGLKKYVHSPKVRKNGIEYPIF